MTTFPKDIGGCLAELATLRKQQDKLRAKMEPLDSREKELREHLINTFRKTELNGAKGSGLSLAIVHTSSPKVADWDTFFSFAKKKGNDDLLNRAVNSAAWRERSESGVAVPGVDLFNNISLRVTAMKKGDKP